MRLAEALWRAFHDDPVQRWIFPGEQDWERGGISLFRTLVAERTRAGFAWTTGSGPGACMGGALWSAPDAPHPAPLDRVRLAGRFLWLLGRRFGAVANGLGLIAEKRPTEPHWYLSLIGTDPAHQGQGVGSALLRPILERCDAEGVPAYLESSKEKNVVFYGKHGFEVVEKLFLPAGPPVWTMRREPLADQGNA